MKVFFALAGAAAAFAAAASSANAGIVCKDDFQKVGGSYLSTPFCRDNYLARVARQYGVKVSDAAIRENPNLKKEVCRLVGRDIRVQSACDSEDTGRGRR